MRDRVAEALASSGLLVGNAGFELEALPTLQHSNVARVRFEDQDGSVVRLVFKQSPYSGDPSTRREARFYRSIAPWLRDGVAPNCIVTDAENGATALLLDDLGDTHRAITNGGPTFDEAKAFVQALASVHATGIQRPDLEQEWATEFADLPGSSIEERLGWTLGTCDRYLSEVNDLDAEARRLVARIIEAGAEVVGHSSPRTIVHGDAHYGNALYGEFGAALLDWSNVCIGPPGVDLAHAIALNLAPEVRHEWEDPLLAAYAERLRREGVFTGEATVREWYRRGVLYALVVPAGLWALGIESSSLMDNVSAAARELEVAEFL